MLCLFIVVYQQANQPVKAQVQGKTESPSGIYDDMGKMWTFDYPPIDYFKKTYNFSPDEKWFEEARLSALRFANFCSASFVSEDGLIMTNHHCARDAGASVQKPGEDFANKGFYAAKLSDERKVDWLYVDQLVKIEDVTTRIQSAMNKATSDSARIRLHDQEYKKITEEYKTKEGWKGLELQIIQFYNGGKYALYGFKRYKDIRLVFMPEVNIGFYGGDYDNFTYPRYDVDCSFFRAYDDNGKPLKTEHYFKFNPNGTKENEPVFIIGNPGSTHRFSAISDLKFRRDVYLPLMVKFLRDRSNVLKAYNEKAKSDSIVNEIFGLENSIKAYQGQLDGLKDPALMARKAEFEKQFKEDVSKKPEISSQLSIWDNIEQSNAEAGDVFAENFMFSTRPLLTGDLLAFANTLETYIFKMRTDPEVAPNYKKSLAALGKVKSMEIEKGYLTAYLKELSQMFKADDPVVLKALRGKSPEEAANYLLENTKLNDPQVRSRLAKSDTSFINHFNDPLLEIVRVTVPRKMIAADKLKNSQESLFVNHSSMGSLLFNLFGTNIPPDATFSLRINDGIVKGYEYNGTLAPPHTTFYGMYDRNYSFGKQYPWALPDRWKNPPVELLPLPLDFVTTNDIIGGNSGSPMINKNREVVGLVFDGNMESLPGDFIYLPDKNRSVGVESVAILGALKYVYKAKRLVNELTK